MAISSLRRTILLSLDEIVPPSALRVLAIPPTPPDAIETLARRPGAVITMGEPDSAEARAAAPFDCIFCCEFERTVGCAPECESLLHEDGLLLLPEKPAEAGGAGDDSPAQQALTAAGLCSYVYYENSLAPEAGYRLESRGQLFRRIGAWVKSSYSPFAHAARLAGSGRPDWAFEVLKMAPLGAVANPKDLATATLAKQRYLEDQFDAADTVGRLGLLWKAQDESHYLPGDTLPFLGEVYARQAVMWAKLGVAPHGAKILRDLDAVGAAYPEGFAAAVASIEVGYEPAAQAEPEAEWQAGDKPPRVLMITPLFPNYGLDVLYDGLFEVLGKGHVDEYPWKPWLHGDMPDMAQNYPCTSSRPGTPLENRELVTRLVEGYYDYVLLPDVETCTQFLHPKLVRLILQAVRDTPVFVVDQTDDYADHREFIRQELDFVEIRGYFKREMIAGVDYGPHVFPCPFSYQGWRVPPLALAQRRQDVFWAGTRNALRAGYIERVERLLGKKFDQSYNQSEYGAALLDSRIGISLAGAGFDTVRYWELPAHGCLLMSERLPTVIPHNFEDGVSAVFADDPQDMAEKLAYYVSHPEETERTAKAGHAHFLKYHTASARARQVLAILGAK